jgi:hypothetical protein
MARISAVLEYASFFPKYTYILPGCGLAKIWLVKKNVYIDLIKEN